MLPKIGLHHSNEHILGVENSHHWVTMESSSRYKMFIVLLNIFNFYCSGIFQIVKAKSKQNIWNQYKLRNDTKWSSNLQNWDNIILQHLCNKSDYLPPNPVCITNIPPLSKLLRPSNCSTVHLYHLMRKTLNVRPCDTITKFMFGVLSPGGWKRPMSISALRVSLKPVAVTLHIMKFCSLEKKVSKVKGWIWVFYHKIKMSWAHMAIYGIVIPVIRS